MWSLQSDDGGHRLQRLTLASIGASSECEGEWHGGCLACPQPMKQTNLCQVETRLVHLVVAVAVAATMLTACTSQVAQQSAPSGGAGGGAADGSGGNQMTSGAGGGPSTPDCTGY